MNYLTSFKKTVSISCAILAKFVIHMVAKSLHYFDITSITSVAANIHIYGIYSEDLWH